MNLCKCCCPDSTTAVATVSTAATIGARVVPTVGFGTFSTSPTHGSSPECHCMSVSSTAAVGGAIVVTDPTHVTTMASCYVGDAIKTHSTRPVASAASLATSTNSSGSTGVAASHSVTTVSSSASPTTEHVYTC